MTVGELRARLQTMSDDAPIYFVVDNDNARDGQTELVVIGTEVDMVGITIAMQNWSDNAIAIAQPEPKAPGYDVWSR